MLWCFHHGIDSYPIKAIVGNGTIGPACQHVALMSGAVIPDLYSQIRLVGTHEDIFCHPVRTAVVAVVGRNLLYALYSDLIESVAPLQGQHVMRYQSLILDLKGLLCPATI